MPLNLRIGRAELPLPAVLAGLMSAAALLALLAYHGNSRWYGIGWMAFGIAVYVYYRLSEDKPLFKRVTVPEKALTRQRQDAEYGSILVPVLGRPLDDDIMQTAGRLAAEENEDMGEGGAVIEALWIFEVPMALPLDARVPDEELKRARRALARAKAVGEEYEGVEVATAVVRARRAGEAIVHEAKRRGVEAIVLAAEEKDSTRGGMVLGGKAGMRDTLVGETTRYVVNKAPCRVILTAAPPQVVPEAVAPPPPDLSAPPPGGDPARPVAEPAVEPASR
jgi:APA family basic amino acid/polyamine antiporter